MVLLLRQWLVPIEQELEHDPPFQPPTAQQRADAIGNASLLDQDLWRVFEPTDEFAPIRVPGDHDWLSKHREQGQTFARFSKSGFNPPDELRRTIYLLPLGDLERDHFASVDKLRDFTAAYFALETKVLPKLDIDESSIRIKTNPHSGHRQWITEDILLILQQQLPDDAFCLLGITLVDLVPSGDWNYVFGMASTTNRVGVYSFARFDPAFFDDPRGSDVDTLILKRSCSVLAHETGHMCGMRHCIFFNCVMNGSNSLSEMDSRPLHPCPVCLRKLHHSIGFDPIAREQALLQVCRQLDLQAEALWLERRYERIVTE